MGTAQIQRNTELQKMNSQTLPQSELFVESIFELDSVDPFDHMFMQKFRELNRYKILGVAIKTNALDHIEVKMPEAPNETLVSSRENQAKNKTKTSILARIITKRVESGNFFWMIGSSLTLFLVPYHATETYEVTVDAKYRHLETHGKIQLKKKSKQEAWFSIIFLFHALTNKNVLDTSERIWYECLDQATREMIYLVAKNP